MCRMICLIMLLPGDVPGAQQDCHSFLRQQKPLLFASTAKLSAQDGKCRCFVKLVGMQKNETFKKTCQDRRAKNSNGHDIVNLPINWTQWPCGTAMQRNSWGQKHKSTSHRTGECSHMY